MRLTHFFAWSFTDNWEWREGFQTRFGIVRIDFDKKGKKFVPEMGCGDGGCAGCGNAEGCTEKDKEAKN